MAELFPQSWSFDEGRHPRSFNIVFMDDSQDGESYSTQAV